MEKLPFEIRLRVKLASLGIQADVTPCERRPSSDARPWVHIESPDGRLWVEMPVDEVHDPEGKEILEFVLEQLKRDRDLQGALRSLS